MSVPRDVAAVTACIDDRMRGFRVYDAAVDVVSCWEALFTQSTRMPEITRHFARFPRVRPPGSDIRCTPDFTVLFDRGYGIAFEIAHVALHENSVESVCRQLGHYATLDSLPVESGYEPAASIDVVLLVPFGSGTAAVRRVILERMQDEDHEYAPSRAPVIIEFAMQQGTGRYVFSHVGHQHNGVLADGSLPDDLRLSAWFAEDSLKIQPALFAPIKAGRPLMNDAPPDLYLAALLWMRLLPPFSSAERHIELSLDRIVEEFEVKFGRIERTAMRRTLAALARIKLASEPSRGLWRFDWHELRTGSESELVQELAERMCRSDLKPRRSARGQTVPEQTPLFE